MVKKEASSIAEKPTFSIDTNIQIPVFPEIDKEKINIRYPLIAPYAYAHIFWDNENKELVYFVEEPVLNQEQKRILEILEDGIKELINISFISVKSQEAVIEYLEKNLRVLLDELRIELSRESYLKIMYYIYRDFVGFNDIEPLLNDYFIEDIECNGVNYPIYVVHRRYRNMRTNIIYTDIEELTSFVEKLAQKAGQYISYANPLLDAALPDGSRLNASFTSDVSSRGPAFTIRKFTKVPWTPTKLIQMRTATPQIFAYLWLLIEYGMNIMVIGGTGSGKTTLLNALTFFIPPQARIVSIEDTRELALEHENWLPSVAREGVGLANLVGQKYGEVSLFDLLKESFRQNPDYVIVGEVRGKEAYVLFQGMSAGHASFGTMHANSVDTMIRRLQTPPISLSASLVEAMDVVLVMAHGKIKGEEARRIREVDEIVKVEENGNFKVNIPFVWDPTKDVYRFNSESYAFNKIIIRTGISLQDLRREFEIRTQLLINLYNNGIFDPKSLRAAVNEYYKDPIAIIRKLKLIKS
ncbi:type II/IV secretion system ATPase subunit [Candidatus Woesearchaeota archaeon]|nr:type II/IV secretion system ATPase subunit [Candidatus Woesearchaeota archaeon]